MDHEADADIQPLYELAFGKRPREELYDLRTDPHQMKNVASLPNYQEVTARLRRQLLDYLRATSDPRALGKPALWDYYPYYGLRRNQDWRVAPRP